MMLRISDLIAQLEDLRAVRGDLLVFQASDAEGNYIRQVDEVSTFIHGDEEDEDNQVVIAVIYPGSINTEDWTP